MKSIISLDTSSDQDDKIRQIIEAELTAVKGVDELTHELTHEQKYLIAQEVYEEYCASSGDGCPAPFNNWIADKCYRR